MRITNSFYRIEIFEQSGQFSVYDRKHGTTVVSNAYFSVNGLSSREDIGFTVELSDFTDAVGTGRSATITGERLMLRLHLYDEHGGIALQAGFRNVGTESVQVREAYPLHTDGTADCWCTMPFVGRGTCTMLTGEGGFSYARVLPFGSCISPNLLALHKTDGEQYASMVAAALTTYEFQTEVHLQVGPRMVKRFGLALRQFDATGKRVDAGGVFWGDWVYFDTAVSDTFLSMETYARRMARMMDVRLNNYNDYVSVCLWYVFAFSCGDRSANTSTGAIDEARAMIKSGITKYAPPLVRLVPDEYVNPNEQLWWDEPHWQRYDHLRAPYETLAKWIDAMHAIGAEGGLYMQPTFRSDDYCALYPEQMLFGDSSNAADYTDRAFIDHMREVYTRIRNAGVRAVFYDYTQLTRGDIHSDINALLQPGGFDDPYATNVSAYRNIFRIAKQTAGPDLMITENTWNYSGQELATGVIDAQRSRMDTVGMNTGVIKSGARQWYRNRVTKLIDPDVKNFTINDRDIRRSEITLMGLLFGKTMLGSSITRYNAEAIRDIGRIFPFPNQGVSARPVDLFATGGEPTAFDYPLPDGAHLLALLNQTHAAKTISITPSAPPALGGLGLPSDTEYHFWNFWDEEYLGRQTGRDNLRQTLRVKECRLIALRPVSRDLQLLSTNRHVLQGAVETEILRTAPDLLEMRLFLVGGDEFHAYIALPDQEGRTCSVKLLGGEATCTAVVDPFDPIIRLSCRADTNTTAWVIVETQPAVKETALPPVAAEPAVVIDSYAGSVFLTWQEQEGMRYRICRDGCRLATVYSGEFTDRSVEKNSTYSYVVITENHNGERAVSSCRTVTTGAFVPDLLYNTDRPASCPFGKNGYIYFNPIQDGQDVNALEDGISVQVTDRKDSVCKLKPADPRGVVIDGAPRLGAVYDARMLELHILNPMHLKRTVTLYAVDVERTGRTMDLTVIGEDGSPLFPRKNIPEYGEGVYVSFYISGDCTVQLDNYTVNAVVNAIYFDEEVC